MSQSNQPRVTVGCPDCSTPVSAPVPGGPGLRGVEHGRESDWEESHRLNGLEATCRNCGHQVELYYY
ncbi:hypothetical protein ACLI4Y_08425 [Natrialbaceae archaeon A-CW3]